MEDFERIILAHYHEIGLKGHNRSTFENRLLKNIEVLTKGYNIRSVKRISGRILVVMNKECSLPSQLACMQFISRIPGVARVSCGYKTLRDMNAISECAIKALSECEPFSTFKVKARRAHTDFPIDSMQINKDIGSNLCDAFPDKKVIMKDPDAVVGIEVVQGSSYVYAYTLRGIGGLPVGSSGRLCCLLSTGIDSPVALWRMARRGAVCIGVHFSGAPQTTDESEYLVSDIAEVLSQTGCISKLYTVRFGTYQREISLNAPPALRVILYRRLMMKTAYAISKKEHARALVTGESLGQVASQTLENLCCTDDAVPIPIFRPLIGTDKQEIIEMSKSLGTFDLSTQDAPDCCTLFLPKAPETHAKLEDVISAEDAFPYEKWIEDITSSATITDYRRI